MNRTEWIRKANELLMACYGGICDQIEAEGIEQPCEFPDTFEIMDLFQASTPFAHGVEAMLEQASADLCKAIEAANKADIKVKLAELDLESSTETVLVEGKKNGALDSKNAKERELAEMEYLHNHEHLAMLRTQAKTLWVDQQQAQAELEIAKRRYDTARELVRLEKARISADYAELEV